MNAPLWLELGDVSAIHDEIIAESGGSPGILNEGALDSTLNKPKNVFAYGDDVTIYVLAASYGYGLIKNHCFVDGNKRIALIVVYTFLAINGVELTAPELGAANYFLDLAASQKSQDEDMDELVQWLRSNSEMIEA
jgi:death on curing protein